MAIRFDLKTELELEQVGIVVKCVGKDDDKHYFYGNEGDNGSCSFTIHIGENANGETTYFILTSSFLNGNKDYKDDFKEKQKALCLLFNYTYDVLKNATFREVD